jgi:hypothetical protein
MFAVKLGGGDDTPKDQEDSTTALADERPTPLTVSMLSL